MDKKSMLKAIISHYTEGNKARFANLLGVSAQTISAWGARNTFDSELIYTKCSGISADWLLSGIGSMLRNNQTYPVAQSTTQEDSSPGEAAVYYKMYKEEKEENKIKVEELNAKMLQMAEEIGNLKAQVGTQHKEPKATDHPPLAFDGGFIESFTSESSGGSVKDSIPMRSPTTSSKKSSAAKT